MTLIITLYLLVGALTCWLLGSMIHYANPEESMNASIASFQTINTTAGRFTTDGIHNMEDAVRVLRECHWLVHYLADHNPSTIKQAVKAFQADQRLAKEFQNDRLP